MNKRTLIVIISLVLVTHIYSITTVSASSTISRTFEDTVYLETPTHESLELFRYTIRLSIETEPDGTWRNNTKYRGYFGVRLDWYNTKVFPYGIHIAFQYPPHMFYYAYSTRAINCTVATWAGYEANLTISDLNYDYLWQIHFQTGSLSDLRDGVVLRPRVEAYIYNGTIAYIDDEPISRIPYYYEGQIIFIDVIPEPQPTTRSEIERLGEQVDEINASLAVTNSLLLILIILLVSLIIVNVALGFSIRKTRKQSTPS